MQEDQLSPDNEPVDPHGSEENSACDKSDSMLEDVIDDFKSVLLEIDTDSIETMTPTQQVPDVVTFKLTQ